jgi:hypothetical protein
MHLVELDSSGGHDPLDFRGLFDGVPRIRVERLDKDVSASAHAPNGIRSPASPAP